MLNDGLILSEEDKYLLRNFRIIFDKSNGYFRILTKGGYQYLHRFLMSAREGDIVDHVDRNKKNNRRDNLRFVTAKLNAYNQDVKNNLGRGVYFDKYGNRYRACISNYNKTIKLGSFRDIISAKKAYNERAYELYGKDAFQHII